MNLKSLFSLSGTLALLLVTSPLVPSFTGVALGQASPGGMHKHHGGDKLAEALHLTPDQKTQISAIRQKAYQDSKAVFTPDQIAARKNHTKPIPLTPDQKQQLKAIHEQANSAIRALLTPEQQATFDKLQQQHEQRRQQHHKNPQQ
jgi:protein CpxP